MCKKWIKTTFPGVRYREHPDRKNGIQKDRYFSIRYKLNGKDVEEGAGWATEDMTAAKAYALLAELKQNQKGGTGPRTLREKRAIQNREQAEQKAEGLTVSEFWEQDYVHNLKGRIKKSSWEKELCYYEKQIKPDIGNRPIKFIRPEDIERMIDKMKAEEYSSRSLQYMVGTVHRIWKHAARRKLVKAGDNPAIGIQLPKLNNTRLRVVSQEELKAIFDFLRLHEPAAYDITLFCAFTGCRFSEAANLSWEYVDFGRGAALFPETKNREPREVFLADEVLKMLQGRGPKQTGWPVFLGQFGRAYTDPPNAFRRAVDALKLNEGRGQRDRLTFHSLRHTAATHVARRGTPIKDLQIMFGWKTPSMVFRYAKGDETTQRRAMQGLAQALSEEKATVIPIRKQVD